MFRRVLIFSFCFLSACASNSIQIGQTLWRSPHRAQSTDLILITPTGANNPKSFLIDFDGKLVKEWPLKRVALNSRIGPDGLLYSLLLAPPENRVAINFGDCDELVAINGKGEEVRSIKRFHMSHDFDFINSDKIVLFELERLDRKAIRALMPHSNLEIAYSDRIIVMDLDGKETWSWAVKDHINPTLQNNLSPEDILLTTGNSLQYIPNNPLNQKPAFLASFRNLNAVLLIEYPSGKVLWQSYADRLSRQHDATLDGNQVLVFDNNIGADIPNLRIQKFDIVTGKNEILWRPPWWNRMTTSVMGGVRLLSNGGFLISNSVAGNIFEISKDGNLNWSFLVMPKGWERSPYLLGTPFYRAEVYSRDRLKQAL